MKRNVSGFTLLEILVVLGIVALLSAVLFGFVNPHARFAKARNDERRADLNLLLISINENIFDNKGMFSCGAGPLPSSSTAMTSEPGGYDVAPCLFPKHLPVVPYDPREASAFYTSTSSYNLGYTIRQDAFTGRVTLEAPFAEVGESITVTR